MISGQSARIKLVWKFNKPRWGEAFQNKYQNFLGLMPHERNILRKSNFNIGPPRSLLGCVGAAYLTELARAYEGMIECPKIILHIELSLW